MKYLATIKQYYDSSSKSFDSEDKAKEWLDSQNNNAERTTTITIYDDNWKEIGSYIHTQGKE